MINKFKLLRNIGCFDSVSAGDNLPLEKLTLLYAENGRGKTTLAAILRSLRNNAPVFINERKRLASEDPPHVIICAGGNSAIFENGAWNQPFSNVEIFDDLFVEENVYSGLVVESEHRKNLHELILGEQGVLLNREHGRLAKVIEEHNQNLRMRERAIPESARGGLSVGEFCVLLPNSDVDEEIKKMEKFRTAFHERRRIKIAPKLQPLDMPEMQLEEIQQTLNISAKDADVAATEKVRDHLNTLGDGAEAWVKDGLLRQERRSKEVESECVFCAQDISGSPMITQYRSFFSAAYRDIQQDISQTITNYNSKHSIEAILAYERAIRGLLENQQFWAQFADIPKIAIDFTKITSAWKNASDVVRESLEKKLETPLVSIKISENIRLAMQSYKAGLRQIAVLNQQIADSNQAIAALKEKTATENLEAIESRLSLLKAIKARYTPSINTLCRAYLTEKQAKEATEQQRDQARQRLEQYRESIFPIYQDAINQHLEKFNAGYRLDRIKSRNTRAGSTCTYDVVINDTAVAVGGGVAQPGEPSFKNALSAGDRNALALAFFLASLELNPNRANKVVVIDDPVSSLDEHRSLTTVQAVRGLIRQVDQVVILSHSKPFLCGVWESVTLKQKVALQVVRQGTASTIDAWDVNADSATKNDRRHKMLRDYLTNGGQNEREIAAAIRPCLEAFFRVAYSVNFPPGTLLGSFFATCAQHVGGPQSVLSQNDIDESKDIADYANKFHHDSNSSLETEKINSSELRGFVNRVIKFTKRP